MSEEIHEPTRKAHAMNDPARRYVYLAGPVEIEDTWRARSIDVLAKMGLEGLDPMRGEQIVAVGQCLRSNVSDSLLVARDLNDLERTRLSGGLTLMNLSKTGEGRPPIGTLFELMWCWERKVPIIAVMGRECLPRYRNHPWIKLMVSEQVPSVTAGLKLIEEYFI